MQIDLSRIAETKGHPRIIAMVDRFERSSASYQALQLSDGRFFMFRHAHELAPQVRLGCVATEDEARWLLQWWITHDLEMQTEIECQLAGDPDASYLNIILKSFQELKAVLDGRQ